jgi:hypothetical protein
MDLAFTFGIITDGSPEASARLQIILDSIHRQQIPSYEILIIGNARIPASPHTRILPFDESQKLRWITRKKNLVTEQTRFANIVYLHDYLVFSPSWYAGFRAFGNDFQACMTPILNADGTRFRDWSLFYDASSTPAREHAGVHQFENLLPYSETSLSKLMYFSGAYWVAKKQLMEEFPLDERLSWGEGEDVVWSHRVRAKYDFSINPNSPVQIFGKKKDPIFREIPPEKLARMKAFLRENPPETGYGCSDDFDVWGAHGHFGPVSKYQPIGVGAR